MSMGEISVGKLQARLELEAAQFHREVQAVRSEFQGVEHQSERTGQAVRSSGAEVDQLGKRFQTASTMAAGFTAALVGVQAGEAIIAKLQGTVERGIGFNSLKQDAGLAFETIIGDSAKAQQHLADLTQFARSTPFELKGLIPESQRLQAYGFELGAIIPMLRTIGNASAGLDLGQEGIDRSIRALGQIQSLGHATKEDLNQLTELGINAMQAIATKLGVSVPQAMAMVSQGAVDAKTTISAVLEYMDARFAGLMEKQAQNFSGLSSNLNDNLDQLAGRLSKPLFEQATGELAALNAELAKKETEQAVDAIGGAFGEAAAASVGAVRAMVNDVGLLVATYNKARDEIRGTFGMQDQPTASAGDAIGASLRASPIFNGIAQLGTIRQFLRDREADRNRPGDLEGPAPSFGNFNAMAAELGADFETLNREAEAVDLSNVIEQVDRLQNALDRARLRANLGDAGGALVDLVDKAAALRELDQGIPSVIELGEAVEKMTAQFGKGLTPEQAAEWATGLTNAVTNAFNEGTPEARAALENFLALANVRLPQIRDENREQERAADKAAQTAKQKADQLRREQEAAVREAQREMERVRERHADLIRGFTVSIDDSSAEVQAAYGRLGGEIRSGLRQAMESEAGEGVGQSLGRNLQALIKEAVVVGVPDAEAAGQELKAAVLRAVSTKDPGDEAAALALVTNLTQSIRAATALTPENFQTALGQSQARGRLGSEGATLVDALSRSRTEGRPEDLKAAADAVAALQRRLAGEQGLTPEQVGAYWDSLMAAVQMAVLDGSEESEATLRSALETITRDIPLDVARNAMADRLEHAGQQMNDGIEDAKNRALEAIQQAREQLAESRLLRDMRENITNVQAAELAPVQRNIEQAIQDYRDFADDRERGHQRELQDADRLIQRRKQDLDLVRQAQEAQRSQGGTRGFSQKELADAAASGVKVGPQQDAGYEAFRRRKALAEQRTEEDAEIERRRGIEDKEVERRRGLRETDAAEIKKIEQTLTDFKKDQATNVRAWEDRLADERLTWMTGEGGPIAKERDARIAALVAVYAEADRLENERLGNLQIRATLPDTLAQSPIPAMGFIVPPDLGTGGLVGGMTGSDAGAWADLAPKAGGRGSTGERFDYDAMAAAFAKLNLVVQADGRVIAEIVEPHLARRNATQYAIGGAGRR